jgi:methyl-accepting chemotaxis protein
LSAIVGFLGSAGSTLSEQAKSLTVAPDAGRSSDEVAAAFRSLSVGAEALSSRIASISSTLADNVAQYRATDARAADAFGPSGVRP